MNKRTNSGPLDEDSDRRAMKKPSPLWCRWSNIQPSHDREYIYTDTGDMTLDDVLFCMRIVGRHARVGFPNDGTFVVDCRPTPVDRRGQPFSNFVSAVSSLEGGWEIIYDKPWRPVDTDENPDASRVFQSLLTSPGPLYGPVYLVYSHSRAALMMCREMSIFTNQRYICDCGLYFGLAPWARAGMVNILTHPAMDSLSTDTMDNICSLLENVSRGELESRHPAAVVYLRTLSDKLDTIAPRGQDRLENYLRQEYPNRTTIDHILSEVLVHDVTHAVYEYLGMSVDVKSRMASELYLSPASAIVTRKGLLPEPPADSAWLQMPTRKSRDILNGFRWDSIRNYRIFHKYLVEDVLTLLTKRRSPRSFISSVRKLLKTKTGRQAHFSLWCTIVHLHRVAQTTSDVPRAMSPVPRGCWKPRKRIKFHSVYLPPISDSDVEPFRTYIPLKHPPHEDDISSLVDPNARVIDCATISILYEPPIVDQRRGPSLDGREKGWVFVEHATNGAFFTRVDLARAIINRFALLYHRNWGTRFGEYIHSPEECQLLSVSYRKLDGIYTFHYEW